MSRAEASDKSLSSAPYFNPMPRAARTKFLLAVFFVFAPLMMLTNSTLAARSWTTMLFWCAASGAVGALWAASFIASRKLLPVAILLTLLTVMAIATRRPSFIALEASRPSVFGVLTALLIAGGYVFFVMFSAGEGARALRLHTELRLAAQIHRSLVPTLELSTAALDIFGRSDASSEMGGDLIDVVAHANRLDLYLADVSGHGVRAGVLMAMVKSALRTKLLDDNAAEDLGHIVRDLNRVVSQVSEQDMFVTLACARFEHDLPRGMMRMRCTLAGHLPILHWRASTRRIESIDNDSYPLGVVDDEQFAVRTIECHAGDLLVLYTDGLIECMNSAGEEFGDARFRDAISIAAECPLSELFETVMTRVRSYGAQVDDQTLLLARVRAMRPELAAAL